MARGARFALAASNPPPPRGRSRRRVRWWTCAPAIEGGKSCKKNPRHSAPTSSALFLSFSLSRSFSPLPTLRRLRFRSTPAGNRRRLYLSAGHAVAPRPPDPPRPSLFGPLLALSLSFVLLRLDPFILARLKGTYVCMASCTPLLCGILGASIERGDLSRAVRGTRPVRVCVRSCARARVHTHVRMVRMTHRRRALVNLINPTDTSGTNVDGQYALSYFPR